MACFMLEFDKQFLCCKDTRTLEVYEIDSLYVAPVRQKYWTHLATVQSEEGQEFELLKIGDGEIIGGCELEILMKDLMCLGMMVNREGLCFLKNPQSNISDQCQVEYYRMFDLFDWSKYDVKSRLNTRWVRNDIVTGRPILEMLREKDAELIENKRLHLGELAELKCKHSQDIEELKCKHSQDIEDLKCRHSQDIEILKRTHRQEIEEKDDDVDYLESRVRTLHNSIKLHSYNSNYGNFEEFYSNLVRHYRVSFHPSKFVYSTNPNGNLGKFYSPPADHIYHLVLIPVGKTLPGYFPSVNVYNTSTPLNVDHWHLLEVELVFTIKEPHGARPRQKSSLLYYDGTAYMLSTGYGVTYPSFCNNENALGLKGWGVYHVVGVGFRLGFICLSTPSKW